MAEKIKVSFIIDKDEVKKTAFECCKSIEEYQELVGIVEKSHELTRDADAIVDENQKLATNSLFSKAALDIIMCDNNDLLATKRSEAMEKESSAKIKTVKVLEMIKKLLEKED